jgi:hypothetical protein
MNSIAYACVSKMCAVACHEDSALPSFIRINAGGGGARGSRRPRPMLGKVA